MQKRTPSKAATHKVGAYGLISKFLGYNARSDQTTLPLGNLVSPSRNVVIQTSGRVSTVSGYILDGAGSPVADSGILSNFDFTNFRGTVRNMRAGFLTSAGNDGRLQYRFYSTANGVQWIDLMTGLTNVRISYTEFWDTTNLVKDVLWVDGTNNIFSWNGSVTTLLSATATTVTKTGTRTWAQDGFAQTGTRSIVINGQSATYTGGEATTTLTGVSFDFSAIAVNTVVHQAPVTNSLSAMTAIPATFGPTVIGNGRRNQVYVGASNNNNLYISKVNNFQDYTQTTPVRVVGDGALIPLDSPPVAFVPLESRNDTNAYDMYISEGTSTWAVIRMTLSSDLTKETLEHIRVKVSPLQGAKSTKFVSKMKNHIIFLGCDNVANFLGYLSFEYVPETVDFSYPIIDDMNSYDFADGSIYYYKNYIYVAIPKSGIIRIYNMTDQTQEQTSSIRGVEDVDNDQPWFWESPVGYPVSGFYTVNGQLYGHSYVSSESYQLFTGGSFNGQKIDTNATFAYDDKGDRTQSKASDEIYVEGYIKQNTTLSVVVSGDLNAFATSQTVTVVGNNPAVVAFGSGGHALGKNPLGSQPLGGSQTSTSTLPAWFHAIPTYSEVPCYLEQVSFSSNGTDLQWEIIAFGTNSQMTVEGNNSIKY